MDKDEQPITGATIKIKDSTTGALTDIEGFYKLELEEENPVLIVSFMGYITQEVKVGRRVYSTSNWKKTLRHWMRL